MHIDLIILKPFELINRSSTYSERIQLSILSDKEILVQNISTKIRTIEIYLHICKYAHLRIYIHPCVCVYLPTNLSLELPFFAMKVVFATLFVRTSFSVCVA